MEASNSINALSAGRLTVESFARKQGNQNQQGQISEQQNAGNDVASANADRQTENQNPVQNSKPQAEDQAKRAANVAAANQNAAVNQAETRVVTATKTAGQIENSARRIIDLVA